MAVLFLFVSGVVFSDPLTVLTLAAWDGLTGSGLFVAKEYEEDEEREFRLDVMRSELKRLDADLAVLTGLNGLPDLAESLSGELGYQGLYGINRGGLRIGVVGLPWNLREGSVMLARETLGFLPLDTKRFSGLFIKNTFSAGRKTSPQVMGGKIILAGRDVYVFSVEWTGTPGDPEEELSRLTGEYLSVRMEAGEFVKTLETAVTGHEENLATAYSTLGFINSIAGDNPVILSGSFNVLPGSREMEIMKRAGFQDAWEAGVGPGYTLDGSRNLNIQRFFDSPAVERQERLDYILYRGEGIIVRDADLVFDTPTFGVHPSDRFGVYARFEIRPSSE